MKNLKINRYYLLLVVFLILTGCFRKQPKIHNISRNDMNQDQIKTLNSLKKINDYPFYTLKYYDNYEHGIVRENIDKGWNDINKKFGCSVFTATDNAGDHFLARNHDFFNAPVVLLYCNPEDGYSSIAMLDTRILGYNSEHKNIEDKQDDLSRLLYAPYFCFDGINSKGLSIGSMAVFENSEELIRGREDIFGLEIVRIVLDHAGNINEAIELFKKYNIYFPKLPLHYIITDTSGRSVFIEYYNNRMNILEKNNESSIGTNFLYFKRQKRLPKTLKEFKNTGNVKIDVFGKSIWRYHYIDEYLNNKEFISKNDILEILKGVRLNIAIGPIKFFTKWSIIYNLDKKEVDIAIGQNYDKIYNFTF